MDTSVRSLDDPTFRAVRRAFARRRTAARRTTRFRATDPSITVSGHTVQPTCTLTGELDLAGVARVLAALPAPAPGARLVIDLSRLSFMDSAGVHLLLDLAERARHEGWTLLVIRGRTGPVRRVLDLCHAERHLPMADVPSADPAVL